MSWELAEKIREETMSDVTRRMAKSDAQVKATPTWICAFCDEQLEAPKKPAFCLNCGEKDAHEKLTKEKVKCLKSK